VPSLPLLRKPACLSTISILLFRSTSTPPCPTRAVARHQRDPTDISESANDETKKTKKKKKVVHNVDIIRGMSVQGSAETFLIKMMADETDAATENEESVERSNLDIFLRLLGGKSTAITEQVDEANSDASIDVENELVLFQHSKNQTRGKQNSPYPSWTW
jgi:hypothetical protein